MFRQVAGAIVLSCVCGMAMAGYGFEPVAALAPDAVGARSIAVGDVSGDGRDDVVVLGGGSNPFYNRQVLVYVQRDGGSFAPPTRHSYDAGELDNNIGKLKLADLDDDGLLDIVVSHGAGLTLMRNEDGLQFALTRVPAVFGPSDFDFMDVDGDGCLDVVAVASFSMRGEVYYGDGAGGVREIVTFAIAGASNGRMYLADMNNDGRRDFVYLSQGVRVHFQQDSGFAPDPITLPLGLGFFNGSIALADFNGDSRMDVAVGPLGFFDAKIAVYYQGVDGTYRQRRLMRTYRFGPASMMVHDFDGDARRDLLALHGSFQGPVGLYLARPAGFVGEQAVTRRSRQISPSIWGWPPVPSRCASTTSVAPCPASGTRSGWCSMSGTARCPWVSCRRAASPFRGMYPTWR